MSTDPIATNQPQATLKVRNPRTGESIKIDEAKVPKFRAGKALKDALN